MGSHYEAPIRKPLVTGNKTYHQISVDVARPIEGSANKQWWICLLYTSPSPRDMRRSRMPSSA